MICEEELSKSLTRFCVEGDVSVTHQWFSFPGDKPVDQFSLRFSYLHEQSASHSPRDLRREDCLKGRGSELQGTHQKNGHHAWHHRSDRLGALDVYSENDVGAAIEGLFYLRPGDALVLAVDDCMFQQVPLLQPLLKLLLRDEEIIFSVDFARPHRPAAPHTSLN